MFNDTPPEKPVIVVFTGNSNVGLAAIDRLLEYGDDIVIRAVVRKAKNADPKWYMHSCRPVLQPSLCYYVLLLFS